MKIEEEFQIPCPKCGGNQYRIPENADDDSLIECDKCGFTASLQDFREHGLELAEKTDFNPYRTKEPRFIDIPTEEKNRKIQANPACGHLICRCEMVTEEEIRQAVRAGATTLDEIKFRTRAGMGRCQGGFCTSRAIQIMAEERGVAPQKITLKGGQSYILARETKDSLAG